MNIPSQKYDPIIEFIDARLSAIKSRPMDVPLGEFIDRGVVSELEGVKRVCEILNQQEALIHNALFPAVGRVGT